MKPILIKCMLCEYKIPHRDITEAGWLTFTRARYDGKRVKYLCLECAKEISHETIEVTI